MARKVANVGAVKQGRNTMSRSASERGRLGVSIGGCSFSGEWAADARLLRCTRQAGQLSRPSPPKSRNTSRVRLWVEIGGEHSRSEAGNHVRKVKGQRGLSHATLVVEQRHRRHRVALTCTLQKL